jgi:methionyl-tRNA formyltransferase
MNKVVVFGYGQSPIDSIRFMLKSGIEALVVIDPKDEGKNFWQKSLLKYCIDENVRFIQPLSFEEKGFLSSLEKFNPNIILSIQCRKIIKKRIIEMVNREIFNFHFADLPRNRGCFPGVWHLLNNDRHVAVSLHKLLEGIDDGPIIDKERKKILLSDTAKDIYFWSSSTVSKLLRRNLKNLLTKKYHAKPQDSSMATYYSRKSVDFENVFINWNKDSDLVARFIQAFIFPPLQFPKTRYENKIFEISGIMKIKKGKRIGPPGTILYKRGRQAEVQTEDGSISVRLDNGNFKKGKFFYI